MLEEVTLYSDSTGAGTGVGVPAAPGVPGTKRDFGYDSIGRPNADVLANYTQPRVAPGQPSTIVRTAMGWQAYEYDSSGNVSSQTIGFPSSTANGKHLYGYDKAGRLTSWTNPAGTATGYGYDASGNRTVAGNATFEFDARNQLTAEKQGAVTKATFTYTPRGTLKTETRDGVVTSSVVDGLGRVVQSGAVSYSYDSLDRLHARTEGTTSVTFAYSGIGSDPVSDASATYYRTPTGRPVALTRNGQTNWIATNRHGDATMLHTATADNNPIVGTQAFDPWGTPITPIVAPLGYQSNWTDPTSKQPWMNARWYQPKTASFTTRDTILGGVGGPSVGHNRHTYANNNPMNYWDPTGRFAEMALMLYGSALESQAALDRGDVPTVHQDWATFYGDVAQGKLNDICTHCSWIGVFQNRTWAADRPSTEDPVVRTQTSFATVAAAQGLSTRSNAAELLDKLQDRVVDDNMKTWCLLDESLCMAAVATTLAFFGKRAVDSRVVDVDFTNQVDYAARQCVSEIEKCRASKTEFGQVSGYLLERGLRNGSLAMEGDRIVANGSNLSDWCVGVLVSRKASSCADPKAKPSDIVSGFVNATDWKCAKRWKCAVAAGVTFYAVATVAAATAAVCVGTAGAGCAVAGGAVILTGGGLTSAVIYSGTTENPTAAGLACNAGMGSVTGYFIPGKVGNLVGTGSGAICGIRPLSGTQSDAWQQYIPRVG